MNLYIIKGDFTIKGKYYTFFRKRKKDIEVENPFELNIICEEKFIDSEIHKYLDKLIKKYKNRIKIEGKTHITDWSKPFFPELTFNEVVCVGTINYSYKAATMEEALKILTAKEYLELYGNINK